MSDAYGKLMLHTSEEFEADFDGLLESLNKFEWNNSGDTWKKYVAANGCFIDLDDQWGDPQYPTVFPKEIMGVTSKDENGIETFIENPTAEEIEDAWDVITDDYTTLETIAKKLSQHIRKGHIEISCVANEKARYFYMENLTIRSNGTASRSRTVSGSGTTENFEETYPEEICMKN
jgi:hypothetical protein